MANTRNGNTFYIDTSVETVSTDKNQRIAYVVLTATAANGRIVLADPSVSGNPPKVDLRVAVSGTTEVFDFSRLPLYFPNGMRVNILTNALATLVMTQSGG